MLAAAAANQAAFAGEHFERVRQLAHRALDGGRLLAEEDSGGLTWTIALAALGWADDFDTVARVSEEGLADRPPAGRDRWLRDREPRPTYATFHTRRIADAAADCRQAIDAHPDRSWILRPFACVQLAWAELERCAADAAEEAMERSEPDERWAQSPAYILVLEARGRVALARGRPDAALRLMIRSGELAVNAGMPNPAVVPWRVHAVSAALRLEQWERARTLAAEELELAQRFGTQRSLGVTLRSAGLAERGGRGVELIARAAAVLEGSGAALEHARTVVELGAAQRRTGSRAVARETLRSGLALAERSGALALAARAREELEAAGARRRDGAFIGPAALTPSELRVARMATEGMTNREIAQSLVVTMKAVQFHLGNIYRKLDTTREQLAAALGAPAPGAPPLTRTSAPRAAHSVPSERRNAREP